MLFRSLVGFSTGTDNRISNCTILTKVSGDAYLGGILGNGLDSDIIIENCTFDGMLTNGSDPKGAFAGWNEKNGTKLVNSCLYIIDSLQNTEGLDLICTDEESILLTDCYKTTPYCKYGTQVRSSKPKSDLCRPLMINGAQYYALPAFSFVDDVYSLEDGVIDQYPVLTDNKKTLEYGKDINVTILNTKTKVWLCRSIRQENIRLRSLLPRAVIISAAAVGVLKFYPDFLTAAERRKARISLPQKKTGKDWHCMPKKSSANIYTVK